MATASSSPTRTLQEILQSTRTKLNVGITLLQMPDPPTPPPSPATPRRRNFSPTESLRSDDYTNEGGGDGKPEAQYWYDEGRKVAEHGRKEIWDAIHWQAELLERFVGKDCDAEGRGRNIHDTERSAEMRRSWALRSASALEDDELEGNDKHDYHDELDPYTEQDTFVESEAAHEEQTFGQPESSDQHQVLGHDEVYNEYMEKVKTTPERRATARRSGVGETF